jgi:DUF4097 and DUF4098 domain-containing protein YvlB
MSWIVSLIIAGAMVAASANDATLTTPLPVVETATCSTVKTQNAVADELQTNTQERIDQTYPLNPNGRINLDNLNGEVVITAWDRNEVRVEAVKTIECDREVQIDVNINATPSLISIDTDYNWEKNGSGWSSGGYRCRKANVDYKLTVPRTARLDQIETVNGAVSLDGLTDYVKASTVNGKVTARNLRGTVYVSSVNGALDVDFDSLQNVRDVKIGMVNGTINLQLPSDIDATVKADTVNGSINNDFGLPVRKGEYVGRNLYGRLGNGGITVKLDGVNGTINIRRKQDGRSPKPVTNLLPRADEGDADEIDGVDPVVSVQPAPRPPRTPRVRPLPQGVPVPQPAPRVEIDDEFGVIDENVRKEVEQALRDSNKAIAQANAEISRIDREKIRQEVRRAQEELRRARDFARLERDFNWNYNSAFFAPTTRETKSIAVEGKPTVKINAKGGSVSIRGWDKSEVSYALVKRGGDETGKQLNVTFDKRGSDVTINVTGTEEVSFRLEVFVPRQSNVRISANRAIRVEGVKGDLNMEGTEQSIDVRDASGKMTVASADGNIRVIGFEGEAIVSTATGNISLEGNFSRLSTKTETGETFITLPENAAALVEGPLDRVTFDKGVNIWGAGETPGDTKKWRIGTQNASDKDGKFTLESTDGQIYIRGLNTVRVTRNYQIADGGEILS